MDGDHSASGLADLFGSRLPLNRKERYFTGTVFPMIVASDDFRHLGRFLDLCDAGAVDVDPDPAHTNIEFFSEYGFLKSLDNEARKRFAPTTRDTPDLLIYVENTPPLLVGIEAKVFHRPSLSDLDRQLQAQADLLAEMERGLGDGVKTCHIALLPAGLGAPSVIGSVPVITWEQVADAYRDVAPRYWLGVLDEALRRYDELASRPADGGTYGQNNDDRISGSRIVELWEDGDRTFTWMGRQGGLRGTRLAEDITAGRWVGQSYEVRGEPLEGNRNWFPIETFVEFVRREQGGH